MALTLERCLTTKEAAAALGLAPSTLSKWRVSGRGPKWTKLGRVCRYLASDLADFVEERRRQSTSQAAA